MVMQVEAGYAVKLKNFVIQPLLKGSSCSLIAITCRLQAFSGEFQANGIVTIFFVVKISLFRSDNIVWRADNLD
jgi:hypothetical protein